MRKITSALITFFVFVFAIGLIAFSGYQLTRNRVLGDSAVPSALITMNNGTVNLAKATSTQIVASNGVRQYVAICNDSTSTVYLAMGATATTAAGYRLATSSCFTMAGSPMFIGSIYGAGSTVTTSTVTYIEK